MAHSGHLESMGRAVATHRVDSFFDATMRAGNRAEVTRR
jgi:hypothetical protein